VTGNKTNTDNAAAAGVSTHPNATNDASVDTSISGGKSAGGGALVGGLVGAVGVLAMLALTVGCAIYRGKSSVHMVPARANAPTHAVHAAIVHNAMYVDRHVNATGTNGAVGGNDLIMGAADSHSTHGTIKDAAAAGAVIVQVQSAHAGAQSYLIPFDREEQTSMGVHTNTDGRGTARRGVDGTSGTGGTPGTTCTRPAEYCVPTAAQETYAHPAAEYAEVADPADGSPAAVYAEVADIAVDTPAAAYATPAVLSPAQQYSTAAVVQGANVQPAGYSTPVDPTAVYAAPNDGAFDNSAAPYSTPGETNAVYTTPTDGTSHMLQTHAAPYSTPRETNVEYGVTDAASCRVSHPTTQLEAESDTAC
jgi:hypothetical protein